MKLFDDVNSSHSKQTLGAGVLLLIVGALWLNSMGVSGIELNKIIATALVFAATTVLSIFVANKLVGGG